MEDKEQESFRPIYESDGICVWASTHSRTEDFHTLTLLESGCLGKISYPTPTACITAIRMFRRKDMDCYKCQFCGSYHLTSKGGDGSLD